MILGILYLFQKEENLSDVNGSIELSMHHMEVLKDTRLQLVTKGFSQVEGIDYNETFSHVAKMNSICLVLSLDASHKWEVHQMDVKSSFFHGDFQEEIYMEQPPGYVQNDSSLVFALRNLFMVSSKLPELGMPKWIALLLPLDSLDAILILMSIPRK
jgi:hypothetical protein